MNLNLLDVENSSFTKHSDFLRSYNFFPAINKQTQFAKNNPLINPSLLDHIFLNNRSQFVSNALYLDITDHCPTFVKLNIMNILHSKTLHMNKFRAFVQNNLDQLISYFSNLNWNLVLSSNDR